MNGAMGNSQLKVPFFHKIVFSCIDREYLMIYYRIVLVLLFSKSVTFMLEGVTR